MTPPNDPDFNYSFDAFDDQDIYGGFDIEFGEEEAY